MKYYVVDKAGTIANLIFLAIVYAGVRHYTGHNCIALSAVAALMFINNNLE